jgi:hypothetical protein
MFERLESREFMSVTLPTTDALTSDATTQPTESVDVTAEKKSGKPNPGTLSFEHYYDKASVVIM